MRKILYLGMTLLALLLFASCPGDGSTPSNVAVRTVYSVSEENISGAGGFWAIPELGNIGDGSQMPLINVYGDQRSSSLRWYPLSNYHYHFEEGRVYIDTASGNSDWYRIVVLR